MKYSDQSYNLRIELDTKNCELTAGEITQLEEALSPLRQPVESFPVTDLYVTIEHTDEELSTISFARSAMEAETQGE
jgi:hypothetical protein